MNPRHSSESNEQYTPAWLADKARRVLGHIDLDPASSKRANQVIKARRIYTKRDNGLGRIWRGNVFLNPPGGLVDAEGREVIRARMVDDVRVPGCTESGACGLKPGHKHHGVTSSAVEWWRTLSDQYDLTVPKAIFLGFSLELLQAVQLDDEDRALLHPLDFAFCIPRQRIRFEKILGRKRVVGNDPTHSNIIVCLSSPRLWQKFRREFADVGYVGRPGSWQ